jgi:sigma-B regulation protein RsbU (phosphoserine phosphatase)
MTRRRLRITLIVQEREAASLHDTHETIDRMIRAHWLPFASVPTIEPMTLTQALHTDPDEYGQVVLLKVTDSHPATGLFRLFDRLDDQNVPALLLVSEIDESIRRLTPAGSVALPERIDPQALCATLHALMVRQVKMRAVQHELQTARRFQGGLRNEIDRMHDELQLAAVVQREFLPQRIPSLPGISFGVLYRPCGYVSGDIYDIQRIDTDHVGVFIADAAGHGVPAALMTMVLARSLVTKRIFENDYEIIPPTEVLETLNREMIRRHGDTPRFATAVYAVVNARTRHVRVACAGHPMPLLYTPDGRQEVPAAGSLLGVFEQAEFEEAEVQLGENDLLVLHSDGFETAFPDQDATAYERRLPTLSYLERFASVAEAHRDGSLVEGIDQLAACIDSNVGSLHQVDDLTALFIAPQRVANTQRSAA